MIQIRSLVWLGCLALVACAPAGTVAPPAAPRNSIPEDNPAQAAEFMDAAERELADLAIRWNRVSWVAATYITHDTEQLSAEAQKHYAVAVQRLATEATRFDAVELPPELRRKFTLLKLALSAPPPADSAAAAELTRLQVSMESDYGRGTYCKTPRTPSGDRRPEETCLDLGALSRTLANSRDPAELLDTWEGWHRVGAPMRDRYTRFVELSNRGARELGFRDTGAMWRSRYDMPPIRLPRR